MSARNARSPRRVVIAGGGVTGLTVAYRLLCAPEREARPLEVTLLEARPSLGGNIRTERAGGFDRELAQPARVRFAHVRETLAEAVDVRSFEGARTLEVQVILDEHDVARRKRPVDAAGRVRDEHGLYAEQFSASAFTALACACRAPASAV